MDGYQELRSEVIGLVEHVVASAGPEHSELIVTDLRPDGTEVLVRVSPKRPSGASILVHVDEHVPVIDVTLGRGGFYEVPLERGRYTDLTALDEVRALCLAAVKGRYRETVWLKGDDVIRSSGVAHIGSREAPVRWAQLSTNPFRRAMRLDLAYEPYDPDDDEAEGV